MGRFRDELRRAAGPHAAGELVDSGVTRRVLAGKRWVRTSYGFYRSASDTEPTPTQRILDVAATLPAGAVIGGWAAAYAQGADLLDGMDARLRPLPVPVLLAPHQARLSTDRVRYVQQREQLPDHQVRRVGGIRFSSPRRTAVDLARWAPDLIEAVVALDSVLTAKLLAPAELAAAAARLRGQRGARQARRAVELSRLGVRSPWESRLRLFAELELSVTNLLVNQSVFDLAGTFLGAPDLLDEEAGLAMEYDGARWRSSSAPNGHLDPAQHRSDNVREELLERAGLIVVRADKVDLTRERARLARRVLTARADGLGRDRRRDRWTLVEPPGWLGMPA